MLEAIINFFKETFVFVGLVSSKNTFPPPLPPEKERELLEQMQAGNPQAEDDLIEHNLRLVAHIAKKYATRSREQEDLISIGTIGLIKAIRTFSNERGRSIAAYAARCIENEILMSIRYEKKKQNDISLSEPIGTDRDGNEITLADVLSSGDDQVSEKVELRESSRKLRDAINTALTDRERIIVVMRYGLCGAPPMPQREVGKLLSISRSYVSRIEKKALIKLNDYLME